MKTMTRPCGEPLSGDRDAEFVSAVKTDLARAHPEMLSHYTEIIFCSGPRTGRHGRRRRRAAGHAPGGPGSGGGGGLLVITAMSAALKASRSAGSRLMTERVRRNVATHAVCVLRLAARIADIGSQTHPAGQRLAAHRFGVDQRPGAMADRRQRLPGASTREGTPQRARLCEAGPGWRSRPAGRRRRSHQRQARWSRPSPRRPRLVEVLWARTGPDRGGGEHRLAAGIKHRLLR